jgi:hypothetical protein
MTTYSNPRLEAVIDNWPSGARRTTATLRVETVPGRGQRGTRTTIDPRTGRASAPKLLTYSRAVRIVDGDDGRTYFVEDDGTHITVMQSNMQFQAEVVWPRDDRYPALLALFDACSSS